MITTSDRILTDYDLHLFTEGTHYRSFEKLGAHVVEGGAFFAVWAPNAESVSVLGDFNNWAPGAAPVAAGARAELAVAPGASWDFLTPIGRRNNRLVLGLAGYRSSRKAVSIDV